MQVVRWAPFQELDAMEKRLRRLFEDTGFAPAVLPAADIYETGDEVVVQLEVPGFAENELDVEVSDHTLSVKGERREEKEEKDKTFHLHQRLERSFERRFDLPSEVDTKAVKAEMEKGVLEIRIGKTAVAAPKKIAIGG